MIKLYGFGFKDVSNKIGVKYALSFNDYLYNIYQGFSYTKECKNKVINIVYYFIHVDESVDFIKSYESIINNLKTLRFLHYKYINNKFDIKNNGDFELSELDFIDDSKYANMFFHRDKSIRLIEILDDEFDSDNKIENDELYKQYIFEMKDPLNDSYLHLLKMWGLENSDNKLRCNHCFLLGINVFFKNKIALRMHETKSLNHRKRKGKNKKKKK
jgi:hypothetical protein